MIWIGEPKKTGRDQEERSKASEDEKPGEYYLYNLAGVVVHMGTANSGHYYSYIRPRDGDGEWVEFNDTIVSTFDAKVSASPPALVGGEA